MKRLLIFASGSGTNADNICQYFAKNDEVKVVGLFCNNPQAGVISKMAKWNVPVELITRKQLNSEGEFLQLIAQYQPDLIILAGFLLLIPSYLVQQFPNKIINIHPALLPKFGGKGMYGHHVHEAVLAQKETEHGITIHLVNEKFDEGEHLFQQSFKVTPLDTLDSIATKISLLEMTHFPKVIDAYLRGI
ncbi:phosphoribosylglycinamide formyltransferase [Bacteroidetes bacterium UKL13-3]|jgi:phosphoribosylglycinamide formyltransferase-1|nr:phosphoribosylglycinamide formyltransferase [Bacteroidetes bacterium UKL13-3]HCP92760.1 phosphoribosylglycinamide formyltransferase [Bacteroidota bacterium]